MIKESILVSDGYVNASKTRGVRTGKEADALRKINALQSHYNGNLGRGKNLTTELTKEKQLLVDMESELGVTMAEINKIFNVGFEPSNGSDKP